MLRRDPVDGDHFRAPTFLPPVGIAVSVGVMFTKDAEVFARAGLLLAAGVVFWGLNVLVLRSAARASARPSS